MVNALLKGSLGSPVAHGPFFGARFSTIRRFFCGIVERVLPARQTVNITDQKILNTEVKKSLVPDRFLIKHSGKLADFFGLQR